MSAKLRNSRPNAGEFWQSRESDLRAEVVSANEEVVWYSIPQWNRPVNCTREVWDASMRRAALISEVA